MNKNMYSILLFMIFMVGVMTGIALILKTATNTSDLAFKSLDRCYDKLEMDDVKIYNLSEGDELLKCKSGIYSNNCTYEKDAIVNNGVKEE